MNVSELKEILNNALNTLKKYDDDKHVRMVTNTYFLGDCWYFLGVSGCEGGYIDLDDPVDEDEYFTLVDRDEDYSIEIQIMEVEVDK